MPANLVNKAFTVKEAGKLGISRYRLHLLLQSGQIEKVGHGQYRDVAITHEPEVDLQLAARMVGSPSAICLLSALAHYNLTDTIPKKIWILAPQNIRRSHSRLRLIRKRNPQWRVGIVSANGYSITNIERTIVESLILHRLIGKNEALMALKRALKTKETTLQKIYNMARSMKVDLRVRPYLETLAS